MTVSYRPGVLLDLDGTLVDSVFHHVMAWDEAFRAGGYTVALWRVHAAIGMGSKRLVPWVLGRHVDDADALSDAHTKRFLDRTNTLQATNGALALLDDLRRREIPFQIATSAKTEERDALLGVLGLGPDDLPITDADDVGSPKPAPDLLLSACRTLGVDPDQTTLIGDSPWDAEAAGRVGVRALAVRCGGFGDDRLLDAGADAVVDDPADLVGRL